MSLAQTRWLTMTLTVLLLAACSSRPSGPSGAGDSGPVSPQNLMRDAEAAQASGDLLRSAKLYSAAHRLEVKDDDAGPEALVGLAANLAALGGHEEAADIYRRALKLDSDHEPALRGLGIALIALGQPLVAKKHLNAALEITRDARAYNALGVAHDMMNDHEAAQKYYRAGIDIDPDDPSLRNNLGLSLSLSGHHDEAVAVLRRVAEGERATSRSWSNLALAFGLAGNAKAAAEVAPFDIDEAAVRRTISHQLALRALRDELPKPLPADAATSKMVAEAEQVSAPAAADAEAAAGTDDKAASGGGAAMAMPAPSAVIVAPAVAGGIAAPAISDGPVTPPRNAGGESHATLNSDDRSIVAPDTALGDSANIPVVESDGDGAPHLAASGGMAAHASPTAAPPLPSQTEEVGAALSALTAAGGGHMRYQVQLGAFSSAERAQRGRGMIARRVGRLLSGIDLVVQQARVHNGLFYRLRTVPLASRGEADALCERLIAGNVDCMVFEYRPPHS